MAHKFLHTIYAGACLISTPIIINDVYMNIWDDIHSLQQYTPTVTSHNYNTSILYTSAITTAIVPSIVLWSPFIVMYKLY